MSFRIAFGRCNCQEPYRDPIQAKACGAINLRLANWRARLPSDLAAVPTEAHEYELVEGHRITFGIHRHEMESGHTLVVFQALVHTWVWPTFLSLGAVGRVYAEGLLVSRAGSVQQAPDEMMWQFR
ncbi:MAG: hypothetical protein ACRD5G_03045 [Candidatus Acidiferrales bacterium]